MKKIYISPSTQEHNVGAGDYGTEERRMNQVADVVCANLPADQIQVFRNRPEMTLKQVVIDSNSKGVDLHFAIHSNAGNETARGTEVLVYGLGQESEKFATIIYNKISALTPAEDRGIKARPDLYELRNTTAQACLIEIAFHDNSEDADFIEANIQTIGEALAHGICEYFGVTEAPKDTHDYKALYEDAMEKLRLISDIIK